MVFETNGVHIQYQCQGSGEPVLLLHGWGGQADSMRPFFNALIQHKTVYAIDFPGHGGSDMPPTPWTVGDFADSTLAFIQAMGIMGCDVIAHSFGGRIVIKLASRDKNIFSRIVLTGVPGARKKRSIGYYFRVYSYKLGKRASGIAWVRRLLKSLGIDLKARIDKAGSSDYRQLPEQMKRTFSNVVKENLRPLLKHIKNPTLLLWGEADTETPLWIAKAMESEIPDCGLVAYPNAGHFAYLECFAQVMAAVSHFLLNEREL